MPLCNRFDHLDLEECVSEEVGEGAKRRLSRARQSTPRLEFASTKKERSIIIVGDSFLGECRGIYISLSLSIGKSGASLVPRSAALPENFLAWFTPLIIILHR